MVLWLFVKVFFAKFGDVAYFGDTSEQSANVYSMKILFSTNSQKFSPTSFPPYGNFPSMWFQLSPITIPTGILSRHFVSTGKSWIMRAEIWQ